MLPERRSERAQAESGGLPVTTNAPDELVPREFTTVGGRRFTVGAGEHMERYQGDTLWSDHWPILLNEESAGTLFRSLNYGLGKTGEPRWQASTRGLYWSHAGDAPIGIGFDVAAFDTANEALAAWGRSADQILDWEAGKPVPNIYAHSGVSQRQPVADAELRALDRAEADGMKRILGGFIPKDVK